MKYRVFPYADDLVIFIALAPQDARVVHAILEIFAASSGLCTNIDKCTLSPICYSEDDVARIQQAFACQVTPFSCRYLGVPLSVFKLRKEDLQPLADAVADHLPSWKVHLMARAVRTTLTKVRLSAIPLHVSITVKVDPWIIRMVDKFHRTFIWSGSNSM
jgi:hypothetical protein